MSESHDFIQSGYMTVNSKSYNIHDITGPQIAPHFSTGRSYLISGAGRDRKYGYRHGKMTDIGDILEEDWLKLARYIIERDSEQDLFSGLVEYSQSCAWLHSNKEREEYALELHMSRIFDYSHSLKAFKCKE